MDVTIFYLIVLVVMGGIFVAQGLPGLLASDMLVRGRYGTSTHYTGTKAAVLGFGYVAAGAFILINALLVMLRSPAKITAGDTGLLWGILILPICWVISLFVGGTAERES